MKIEDSELEKRLEDAWSPPDGFLFELREGLFDPFAYDRLIELLRSVDEPDGTDVPRRVVALLWYIPAFMGWQHDRVAESEGDLEALSRAEVAIRNELERILGAP